MRGENDDGDCQQNTPGTDLSGAGSRWITPESSMRIRSRMEELEPGRNVGEHMTHHREEVVIFLQGQAQVTMQGTPCNVASPWALYIGPQVKHDIRNTGDTTLRYVYVVALHE